MENEKTVLVSNILTVENEKTFRSDEETYRKQCTYELMDELVSLGVVEIDTCECTVLCGCIGGHEPHCIERYREGKPLAVRAKIRLPDRSYLKQCIDEHVVIAG